MTGQADITRIKAHGIRFFGITGEEFLAPDGRILTAAEALELIDQPDHKPDDQEGAA